MMVDRIAQLLAGDPQLQLAAADMPNGARPGMPGASIAAEIGAGRGGGGGFAAPREVSGGGNTRFVQKPDGRWWQYDNFGPVGPMPPEWAPR